MKRILRRLVPAISACLFVAFTQQAGHAAPVNFFEDFESGVLSPTNWLITGNGQIVADPLNAANKVLSFSQLAVGGDLFSVPLNLSGPSITIQFDYLGISAAPAAGTDTGGFVIVDIPNSFSGYVLLGTNVSGGPLYPNMLNLAPGVWHHISVTLPAAQVQGGDGSKVAFEQWAGSLNTAGFAYFDNIQVNSAPEPLSFLLVGAGLAFGFYRRRR